MENYFNKLYKNINNTLSLLKILPLDYFQTTEPIEKSIYTRISLSFTVLYLTDFEFKLNIENMNYFQLLALTNKFLQILNCKFLINEEMTEIEYINFIIYFFTEFDFINDYVEYIRRLEKKHIIINIEQIINLNQQYVSELENDINKNTNFENCENLLSAFNRLNFIFKNIKKQIDQFINLSVKLNQIRESQEKPKK
jgi:hypothetical protein